MKQDKKHKGDDDSNEEESELLNGSCEAKTSGVDKRTV